MQKDHFYSIFRTNANILKGEEFKIADMTSTDLKIVDSVSKLFSLMTELKGNESKDLDNWKFLKKWGTYNTEKKH